MEGNLLLVLCLLCFIIGFLNVALYISWQQASQFRNQRSTRIPEWPHVGCYRVISLSKENQEVAVDNKSSSLTEVEVIDEEIRKAINLGLRDYVEKWYHGYISEDPVCVEHVRDILTHVISELSASFKQVDYLSFFAETIMDDFMDHLRCYKTAYIKVQEQEGQEKLMNTSKLRMIENFYFDEESKDDPWRVVCCTPEGRLVYFQRVTEILLCLLLPPADFSNPALQVLLSDLGACQIWGPLLHMVTQPDNINHSIISLGKDCYLTPESFSTAISEGSTELELRSLQYKINTEIKKLQKNGVTDLDHEKLSSFEAIKDTARLLMDGEVKSQPSDTSSLLSLKVEVPSFIITQEGLNKHCEFVLNVCCRHSHASVDEKWTTHRRYRDFQDMHLTLKSQLENFPSSLNLPALPAFNKLDPQRLEARRLSLDKYISTITTDGFLKEHPQAINHLVLFLTEGEFIRSSTELKRVVDTLLNPLSKIKRNASLKFPTKKPSSSTLTGTGQTILVSSSPNPSPSTGRKISEARPTLSEEDEDSLPVDIMLVLLEELFDFSDKKWLRRQLPTILKQLAGGKISRKVVQVTDWLTSHEQVAQYVHDLTDSMWPGGIPVQPHPSPSNDVRALWSLLARAKLIGSIPDELKMLIGNESTIKGMIRLFWLFQVESLNLCLALRLLEGLLETLFPSRNIKDTLKKLRIEIQSKKNSAQ